MDNFSVVIYQDSRFEEWNSFIQKAANATFLFDRNFMEYHCDRFDDYSLMIYKESELLAVFPAHRIGDQVFSHSGLTYGGLCLNKHSDVLKHQRCLEAALQFFRSQGITKLSVKVLPEIYSVELVNQFKYIAFQLGGVLKGSEMNMSIDYRNYSISKSKLKHLRKHRDYEIKIVESDGLEPFWQSVLEPLLVERYQAKPVHSLLEILKLQARFPEKIKQFSVYSDEELVGGITVFEFEEGVKSQYGAATSLGKEQRALDHLFVYLIKKYEDAGMRFFDMGVVTDSTELGYNRGLLQQKKELGCTTYLQDIIEFEL